MGSPSRRIRRRQPRTCATDCPHLTPQLEAARTEAVDAVTRVLRKIGDPVGDALNCLAPEEFAGLVWQSPQPDRTHFLTELGLPPAKRPTVLLARMGVTKLQTWPGGRRNKGLRFITNTVADRIDAEVTKASAIEDADSDGREAALLAAVTRDPGQRNMLRLALLCHGPRSWTMTIALRVVWDAVTLAEWAQVGDDLRAACQRLEQVWEQIADAHAPTEIDTPEDHDGIGTTTDITGDGIAAEPDVASPPGQASEPTCEGTTPVPAEAPEPDTADVSAFDPQAAASELVDLHATARDAAETFADTLNRGGVPAPSTLEPITAFIAAAGRVRDALAASGRAVPADASVEELTAALNSAGELHQLRDRLAEVAALTGPDSVHGLLAEAADLADGLRNAAVWDARQQAHATGLVALLDLVDAAESKDMQALAGAFAAVEQHLPDVIAGLRMPALGGNLHRAAAPAHAGHSSTGPVAPQAEPVTSTDAAGGNVSEPVEPATAPAGPVPSDPEPAAPQPVAAHAGGPATDAGTPADDDATTAVDAAAGTAGTVPGNIDGCGDETTTDGPAADTAAGRTLVRQLLGEGRLSLAHHAAVACGDRRRADALRVLALADAARSETSPTAATLTALLESEQDTTASGDTAVQLLLLAGSVRACLVTADAAAGRTAQTIAASLRHLPGLAAVADTIGTATAKRRLYSPDLLAALAPLAGAGNDVAQTVEAARSELTRPRGLDFVRAAQIADRLWAPDGVVGRILTIAADDRASELETALTQLRLFAKRQYVDDLLDTEDEQLRSGRSRKLQGRQRSRLKELVDRSVGVVRAWTDAVRANQVADLGPVPADLAQLRLDVLAQWPAAEQELQDLIAETADTPWMLQGEAGRACLSSMRRSVDMFNGVKPAGTDQHPDVILYRELLCCPDLPFTVDGTPAREVTLADVCTAASTGWQEGFAQRIDGEDYATAAMVLGTITDPDTARAMSDQLTAAAAASFNELTALHAAVTAEVGKATRLGQLDETAITTMTGILAADDLSQLPHPAQECNLGAVRRRLLDVREQLPRYLHETQEALRRRADNEVPAGDRRSTLLESINARIEAGDLATAEEYLLAAVQGDELPRAEPSDDLQRFLDLTVTAAGGLTPRLIEAVRSGTLIPALGVTHLTAAQRATADTLQTWLDMRDIRNNRVTRTSLMAAMRLAGIEFAGMQQLRDLSGGSRRGWWDLTDVRRIGETPGVPQFAPSADGRQRVMLCWGEPDVRAMFGWLNQDPDTDKPVIVLVFAPMTAAQREQLAMMCTQLREKPIIVIDDIALLHLALHGSGQFLSAARTLLPFAATNPYAPDSNSALPPEMFFGRRSERSEIISPTGANLLYGGRQLGKTALLMEAARTFARVDDHVPIYVTLHNAIGTKVNPLSLWDRLGEKLAERGIFPPPKERDPVKKVTTAIKNWLTQNPARRMLLLIDECDGFFDADAENGFVHVTQLRNLRDDTGRRCKPVFAGLHQVQRFAHLPNQPLASAHLGEQIAIGPLSPEPAYRLLFTPMEALGIRFESDELIHRVLAYCNYQPKLLQMVGKAVAESALSRRRTGPYYWVDEDMLDQVLGSEALKQRIRQTVRLTLDLDSRYKLIALIVAHAALENGADHTMETSQLRRECDSWWVAGFAKQEPAEFRSLLDEMRDLGVLAVTNGNQWRLRSTNVLRLLGSTDEIWEELCSSQWRTTVTKLSGEEHRRHLDDGLVYPCTDQQLSRIVGPPSGNVIRVIAGSPATGVSRVRDLLEHSRKGFGARFDLAVTTSPQTYGKALRGGEPGGRRHVVLSQLLNAKPDTIVETITKAMQIQPNAGAVRTVTVLVDVTAPGVLDLLTGSNLPVSDDDVITLRRATDVGMRGWLSDNELMKAFTDATSQAELMAVTGGWPLLMDLAAAKAPEHTSTRKVCDQVTAYLASIDGAAEFLEAAGLQLDTAAGSAFQSLIEYAAPVTSDELVELCSVTGSDPERTARTLRILNVLDQSDIDGRWAPEPVTTAAWRRLHNGG
jgi:hypothetical protein